MKKSRAVLIGASIAVAIGVLLLLVAIPTSNHTTSVSIPSENYAWFEWATVLGVKVSGSFEVASGDQVTLKVFDGAGYDQYALTGNGVPLDEASGISGTFEGSRSGVGILVIVIENYEPHTVELTMDYSIAGLAVTYFGIGVAVLVIGVVLGLLGRKMRIKEAQAAPPSPAATD